jgi:glutathione S-transferase
MTPILFYGVPAGSSFGSIVALEWLGQPYRVCRTAMPEAVTTPAYHRINPLGETPALLTAEGVALAESMAILHHVNALGVPLGRGAAQGTQAFDRMGQALAFLNTTFYGAFAPLWWVYEHAALPDGERTALRTYGRCQVELAHAALERLLAGRRWMAGDERTVADAYFFGVARWLDYHQLFERNRYPRVHALYERLRADPAVALALAMEEAQPLLHSTALAGHVPLESALREASL